jgi:hypothetical protein
MSFKLNVVTTTMRCIAIQITRTENLTSFIKRIDGNTTKQEQIHTMSATYNPPLENHAVRITDDILKLGDDGVDKFITDNGLTIPATPFIISVANTSKKAVGTIAEYSARWLEFKKFCYLKGDYQSATLAHRTKCPENPLPRFSI